jgi:hypothetical protein
VEEALRTVGRRDLVLRARLLAKLAVVRRLEGKDADAGRALAPALALAKRLRHLPLQCGVLVDQLQMMQYGMPGDHTARLALTDKLLHVAERAKNAYAMLQGRRHRVALFLDVGAGRELDDEIEHFARASAVARCKQHYAAVFRSMRAIVSGRFEVACETILEVEALADPLSPEQCRFTPVGQRFNLPPDFRDSVALAHAIDELIREYPQMTGWRIARGVVALDCGDTEAARAALEQGAGGDFALVPRNVSYVIALALLARIGWGLGDTRYALELHELLLPYAGWQVSTGVGTGYEGPVDWYLGVLAVQLGRRREAARRFAGALAATERLGAWPWRARTELTYAGLLATGSATERARAHSLASSAATTAVRLGMRQLHVQAEEVLIRLCSEL